ncbi:LuxR C-terminal-related transcriptional regulator [Pseudoduganella sp. OTU4001]|uniref:LuxR C-terminal-related transcriptional regulator n=1 Tax=Pseudoduganella sp. OTU4001 TaxID=3043854 RepID=UPI00313B28F3
MLFSSGTRDAATDLILKTTPPRAPRHMLLRPKLQLSDPHFRGCPVLALQAPAGYGKTSVLAQWRREALGGGAAVAWLLADYNDEPARFVRALVQAVRNGCARPAFGSQLLEGASITDHPLDALTAWLAELAATSLDVLLMVDEADTLPPASAELLAYLMHNAPQNLRVVAAARASLADLLGELLAYGQCVVVGPELLRFSYDETRKLVAVRFGAAVDAEASARLHELTAGWPLGLQLALAAMEHGREPGAALTSLAAENGTLHERVMGVLLDRLAPADQDFLLATAITNSAHPELCVAVSGQADAAARLARLARETPLFLVAEDSAWCRLHPLAHELLLQRLQSWPAERRQPLHARAAQWLAERGMLQEAARQAHAAGQTALAFDLAERCLLDAVRQGELGALEQWRQLLPEEELARRPRLGLAAAWVMALGEHHRKAEQLVAPIEQAAGDDAALRYECALIVSAAAYYADEVDRFVALMAPWAGAAPPTSDPWLLQAHANRLAATATLQGDPARARRHQQAPQPAAAASSYVRRWGEFLVGQSYLWEGQVRLAQQTVRPALQRADADLGRRHPLAAMFAALLAAAEYEAGEVEEAQALLAYRLDVLERSGTPDTVLLAYRTAARCALAQGAEHRALDLLEGLHALGAARSLPRLCAASLVEQVQLHARQQRAESARAALERLQALLAPGAAPGDGPLWRAPLDMLHALSQAYAAMAGHDWQGALAALDEAGTRAAALRFGRITVQAMGLRALATRQCGRDGEALLHEAQNLAATYGLQRTLADAHPMLADWLARKASALADSAAAASASARAGGDKGSPAGASAPRALPSMVLTPKEREVLELLARNLSNKEIAQAMAVGEETVKWHLKNLFGKLDAASRKHVVRRAQLLGLLEGG